MSTGQLESFGSDLLKVALAHARGFAPWADLVTELLRASQALRAVAGSRSGRQKWLNDTPVDVTPADWGVAMGRLLDVMDSVGRALSLVAETSPELHALQERVRRLKDALLLFTGVAAPGFVRWLEVGSQLRLVYSPLDIALAMQTRVVGLGEQRSSGKSWIFTSATLGHDTALTWFVRSCGLEGAHVLQVPSPFDYKTQAALYIPNDLPRPSDAGHSAAVAQLAAYGASCIGGRTMVLTTTLRAMRSIGQSLRDTFGATGNMQVLVQGEASKRELIARFCREPENVAMPCVLVASASFWEGIDIPGEALQLLVIDKLPFAPPDDPLQQARAEELEAIGKNPFRELHLPQAAVALKQGAGRLIRRESDRGILVVCDTRLVQMSYGRKLLDSLPPMQRIETKNQWLDALAALTRPSTRDPW
jgi:ATP-dependent DNA helicase DinG